jgi:transcription initiation factor IIE alpha subunit
MNYNKECPCCHWKFYVDEDYDSHAVCVKCGSIFK